MADPTLSRRSWLSALGAASAASLAVGTPSEAQALSLLRSPEAPAPDRVVPSYCELCFWNCGLLAEAKGNRILALRGHPDYPNARGKLCARGNAGAAAVRDENRLAYPMVRVGARGEGKFERVGWRTAYRTIAQAFAKSKRPMAPSPSRYSITDAAVPCCVECWSPTAARITPRPPTPVQGRPRCGLLPDLRRKAVEP